MGRRQYPGQRRLVPPEATTRGSVGVAALAAAVLLVVANFATGKSSPFAQDDFIPSIHNQPPTQTTDPEGAQSLMPSLEPTPAITVGAVTPMPATPKVTITQVRYRQIASVSLSYEAEMAEFSGIAAKLYTPSASGGALVHQVGTNNAYPSTFASSGYLTFTNVTATKSGQYALTIFYATKELRQANIRINNGAWRTLDFYPSGGWDVVSSATFTIELPAGRNSIAFGNPFHWAPSLDRITLLG